VLGDGKLGLLIAMVLQAHGYKVRQFGHHAEKLKISAAAGVDVALASASMPQAVFDWTVDATGSAEGLRTAAAMTRPRGTVILKSTVHGTVQVDTAAIIVNELTLVGSRCGHFEVSLPLLEQGSIPVEAMIDGSFPLQEAPQAFERATQKGVLKVLLRG
jgi:threonine dehydrogenase-like Zn-dependent dehydrogenase